MLMFLASVLEQLDFAFEQVEKRDVHNARFSLMLTDNALELVLHQIAKDKAAKLKIFGFMNDVYKNQTTLDKALKKDFRQKVRFARVDGYLDHEISQSINIMHGVRNEVYHAGLQHESVLPNLALFHFEFACHFIASYRPSGIGWGSSQELPGRAKKYFTGKGFSPGSREDFQVGCVQLATACKHDSKETLSVLAGHMEQLVEQQDICIDIISQGAYGGQQKSRDEAVVDTQAWQLAFSSRGKRLCSELSFEGSLFDWINWLTKNQQFQFASDPISSWKRQIIKMRSRNNLHAALAHYASFMNDTASFREAIEDSARQVEAEIDDAIDRYRGK
ncbi:MAG: hypothetical protein ACSHYC_22005 [Alphaproteobacteria bacterium]